VAALTKGAEIALQILTNAVEVAKGVAKSEYDSAVTIINMKRSAESSFYETQKTLLNSSLSAAKQLSSALQAEASRISRYMTDMKLADNPSNPVSGVFSAQARLRAGDTSDSTLKDATSITPDMFDTWADYAVNYFETRNAIGEFASSASQRAGFAAADVNNIEALIKINEETHALNLERFANSDKIAQATFDSQIKYYDLMLKSSSDQLQEVLGTKLAVMSLGAATDNYTKALMSLSTALGSQPASIAPVSPIVTANTVNYSSEVMVKVLAELEKLNVSNDNMAKDQTEATRILTNVTAGGTAMATEAI